MCVSDAYSIYVMYTVHIRLVSYWSLYWTVVKSESEWVSEWALVSRFASRLQWNAIQNEFELPILNCQRFCAGRCVCPVPMYGDVCGLMYCLVRRQFEWAKQKKTNVCIHEHEHRGTSPSIYICVCVHEYGVHTAITAKTNKQIY